MTTSNIQRPRPTANPARHDAQDADPRQGFLVPEAAGRLLTIALNWGARGVPVLPVWSVDENGRCRCGNTTCANPGKHPLAALVPHGCLDATTDTDRIRAWWTRYPDANLATATAWTTVLDVDPRHGGDQALAELEAEHGALPATPEIQSGGGGRHLYFMPEPGLAPSAGQVGVGLDIKTGPGAYVLLPPSRHVSGGCYAIVHSFKTPRARMPDWLVTLASKPTMFASKPAWFNVMQTTAERLHHAAAPYARLLQGVEEGRRRAGAAALHGHYAHLGLAPDEIEEILVGYARRCAQQPTPFSDAEARGLARDLARRDAAGANFANFAPSPPAWPTLPAAALSGLAGEIVRTIEPYTEADPAALLLHLLVGFGNVAGDNAHMRVGSALHPPRVWSVVVGDTAKGRKGTAWAEVRALLEPLDLAWAKASLGASLSSGEGLIYAVRDRPEPEGDVGEAETDIEPTADDKRLLVVESEFASVLKVMSREGNTLSPILRSLYDSGAARPLTKNAPIQTTHAHISIIAHVTRDDLRRYLHATDQANGFANRFCWSLVERSKIISRPYRVPADALGRLSDRLRAALVHAQTRFTALEFDASAGEHWDAIYPALSEGRPGLLGGILNRAEAQVLRLALVYALLDCAAAVGLPHLTAAQAVWEFSVASARRIFFGLDALDKQAQRILEALRAAPDCQLDQTEVYALLGNHASRQEIEHLSAWLREWVTILQLPAQGQGERKRILWRLR